MWILAIPIGLGFLLWGRKPSFRRVRTCTPAYEDIFVRAMHSRRPSIILQVAEQFDAQGFDPSYGERLRRRARLPALSPGARMQLEAIFRKALTSQNSEAVRKVATAFAHHGLTHGSKMLFDVARGLDLAAELQDVEMILEEEQEEQETFPAEPEPEVKTRIADETSEMQETPKEDGAAQ